jgi:hypothetical protein
VPLYLQKINVLKLINVRVAIISRKRKHGTRSIGSWKPSVVYALSAFYSFWPPKATVVLQLLATKSYCGLTNSQLFSQLL